MLFIKIFILYTLYEIIQDIKKGLISMKIKSYPQMVYNYHFSEVVNKKQLTQYQLQHIFIKKSNIYITTQDWNNVKQKEYYKNNQMSKTIL